MKADEDAIRAVEKVLKEPVAAEFSDQAWRIRTNLIIACTIGLVMGLADLHIHPDSTILGLKFNGLSDSVIRITLVGIVSYLLFHFLWVAGDGFLEWRLRITGTRKAFVTGSFWESSHADSPIDPRQSTLYNWWHQHSVSIGSIGEMANAIELTCKHWEADLVQIKAAHPGVPDWQNTNNAISGLAECREQAAKLARHVAENTKAITDARIPASLQRFDRWYSLFLRSQNVRWLAVEFLAPILFACYTLFVLL